MCVSDTGQKYTIDKFSILKYEETMNTFFAVITFPKYTYDSKLKQIDAFEIIENEVMVACIFAILRIAATSLLRDQKKIQTDERTSYSDIWLLFGQ